MSTFFWAHGLPVEEGFGDNRDLMMVQDGKVTHRNPLERRIDTGCIAAHDKLRCSVPR